LAGEFTPKFLATLDGDGRPNCVPVISITPYEDDLLVFGEFMLNKSRKNLLTNDKVGIAVLTSMYEAWSIKGVFLGFETTGPRLDFANRLPMFRYNAYTGVRAAGLIRVTDVSEKRQLVKTRILWDFARVMAARTLLTPLRSKSRCMPRPVQAKFGRLSAVRALAFKDADGFPRALPLLACVAAGSRRLAFAANECAPYRRAMAPGTELAVAIITMEPIAYQVKGRYRGSPAGIGVLDITECYSASPPLVGERLDHPVPV
jgi:hypothetical protein